RSSGSRCSAPSPPCRVYWPRGLRVRKHRSPRKQWENGHVEDTACRRRGRHAAGVPCSCPGEVQVRAELVPRRRPCRLLGGAGKGLLRRQGPRRNSRELEGL